MGRATLFVLLLTIVGCGGGGGGGGGQPPPIEPIEPVKPVVGISAELLDAHNIERLKAQLPIYRLSPSLTEAAAKHAVHMAKVQKLGHYGIGDGDPWGRIQAAEYHYSSAGENAAAGQRDVRQVMSDWMGSPGHRQNVLGKYVDFGGAMSTGKNGVNYWCTVFAIPRRAATPPPIEARSLPAAQQGQFGTLVPPAKHGDAGP